MGVSREMVQFSGWWKYPFSYSKLLSNSLIHAGIHFTSSVSQPRLNPSLFRRFAVRRLPATLLSVHPVLPRILAHCLWDSLLTIGIAIENLLL